MSDQKAAFLSSPSLGGSRPVNCRIVCSGLVDADAGSVASASFEVLKGLLEDGYEVDFFSDRSFVYPELLLGYPRFSYIDCARPGSRSSGRRARNRFLGWAAQRMSHAAFARRVLASMRDAHRDRRYDVMLFLGHSAYGRVEDVPVISWVQGPPGTDARSIFRHGRAIRSLCGILEYAELYAYSIYRESIGLPPLKYTDVTVCGSRWSAEMLSTRYGVPADRIRTLAYPIDTDRFRPSSDLPLNRPLEIAWVGRVVPRKRLDLFLDAGAALIDDGWDVTLTVVGDFPFARGFYRLLDSFPHPERLTYRPNAPRADVLDLLQRAAVLVQPSEEENFGSSVAEALACGTPVVLGPTNGTGDYLQAGGVRFAEHRAGSVARAIAQILGRLQEDPVRTRAAARAAADANFRVGEITDALGDIIYETIASSTTATPGVSDCAAELRANSVS